MYYKNVKSQRLTYVLCILRHYTYFITIFYTYYKLTHVLLQQKVEVFYIS